MHDELLNNWIKPRLTLITILIMNAHAIFAVSLALLVASATLTSGVPKTAGTPPVDLGRSIQDLDQTQIARFAETAAPGAHRNLAMGVRYSWSGDADDSARLLKFAVSDPSSLDPQELEEAVYYLALEESLLGKYAAAYDYGRDLLRHQHLLSGNDLSDFSDQVDAWRFLSREPHLSVALHGVTRLASIPNSSGRLEAYVKAKSQSICALFDTGAEMTVINRSTLVRLGLKPLPGETHDTGSSGAVSVVQLAMLPNLEIGTITAKNVPVMVEEDSALQVGSGKKKTPVDMILGYTVIRRLGSLGVSSPHQLSFNEPAPPLPRRVQLLEIGAAVVLTAQANDHPACFLLDTGATSTTLTRSFYQANISAFPIDEIGSQALSGVGGSSVVKRYILPNLSLKFVRGKTILKDVAVVPDASALDVSNLYGNMGRDLWGTEARFHIDFRRYVLSF